MANSNAEKFMKNYDNYAVTENGALGYKTSLNELVDLNFKTSSLRHMSEDDIKAEFEKAYAASPDYAVKWAFYLRDILEGNGERRSFRVCMQDLAEHHPDVARAVMPLIPQYGRYDDLLCFLGTKLDSDVKEFISEKLKDDVQALSEHKPVSLLGKWMPSMNASSQETRHNALALAHAMNLNNKEYRQMLSSLRSAIGIIEKQISAGKWDEIDYSKVPAKANMKYDNAFIKHDRTRRLEYFKDVILGDSKLNINGLAPYEIVHKLRTARTPIEEYTPEIMWDVMREKGFGEDMGFKDAIVVTDVSGSMTVQVDPKSSVTALDVAESLSIYFSEQLPGIFKDKAISFSAHPQLIDMSNATSLKEKLEILNRADWGMNTNIEAVFDMLLSMAKDGNVPAEEIPKQVVIISDMEFDEANSSHKWAWRDAEIEPITEERLFDVIGKRYEEAGYELPKLVFWNVNSRTHAIPMIENDRGIALLSGFSQNAAKMVLKNQDEKDPAAILMKHLDSERYAPVGEALETLKARQLDNLKEKSEISHEDTPSEMGKAKMLESLEKDIDESKSLDDIFNDIGEPDYSYDDIELEPDDL